MVLYGINSRRFDYAKIYPERHLLLFTENFLLKIPLRRES